MSSGLLGDVRFDVARSDTVKSGFLRSGTTAGSDVRRQLVGSRNGDL